MSTPVVHEPFDRRTLDARDYWVRRLGDADEPGALIVPRIVVAERGTPAEGRVAFELPREVSAELLRLARGADLLVYTTLLSALRVLLWRWSGVAHPMIAVPMIAEAGQPESHILGGSHTGDSAATGVIASRRGDLGDLSDLIVIGRPIAKTLGFRALLLEERADLLSAYEQPCPLERVIEALGWGALSSERPICQVGLWFEPLHGPAPLGDLDIAIAWRSTARGDSLSGEIAYAADRIHRDDMERLAAMYVALLQSAMSAPETALGRLSTIAPDERRRILDQWSQSSLGSPSDESTEPAPAPAPVAAPVAAPAPATCQPVVALIEQCAARTPDAIALRDGDATVSFADLDARATRLAHRLRRAGVGPESIVALLIESTPTLIAAMLATWKAGGAYVPIALTDPPDRRAFCLRDAGARVLVTDDITRDATLVSDAQIVVSADDVGGDQSAAVQDTHIRAEHAAGEQDSTPPAPAPPAERITPAERTELAGRTEPAERAEPEASEARHGDRVSRPPASDGWSAAALAYVLYTSGSTGTPKGVAVSHGALAQYVAWSIAAYEIRAGAGTVLHTPLHVDLSVTSVWSALAAGRTVSLVASGGDGSAVGAVLARATAAGASLSLVKLAPAHLAVWEGAGWPAAALAGVRTLVIGGEALRAETLGWWRRAVPSLRVVNEYGPTEATVGCCVADVPPEVAAGAGTSAGAGAGAGTSTVSIGRPIPGARLYVVDGAGQPVPVGVAGELWIGGIGLARGYVGRRGLTADRFVPDPFSGTPGARLYRTGDLVRWQPDGTLAFVGRRDTQVKIRGHRVELGEVEARLATYAGVRAVVVIACGTPARLVAYVVAPGAWPGAAALRAHAAAWLPAAAVPAQYVALPALPLTRHGKVDRAALPAPPDEQAPLATTLDPVAELLAQVWRQLLGTPEPLGPDDHFFARGGHSLLALQLVTRIRETYGVTLPLRVIFETPRLGALAEAIRAAREAPAAKAAEAEEDPPPVLQPVPRTGPVPLSLAQQRLWFLAQLTPDSPFYNVAAAVQIDGHLALAALAASLHAIGARHEILRTRLVDGPAQEVLPVEAAPLRLPRVDLTALPVGRRLPVARRLVQQIAARPLALDTAPLVRVVVLRVSAMTHVLGWVSHHLVSDGWSMRLWLEELRVGYLAASRGALAAAGSALPPLAVQYADYAIWQRAWLTGARRARQVAYWRTALAGAPALSTLTGDRPRPAVQRFRGARVGITVPPPLTAALYTLAQTQAVTIFLTLLAALAALLARLTGQTDLVLGTPIAHRPAAALEPLIGFFANTLPLRVHVDRTAPFTALLPQVRAHFLDAAAHQQLPFDALVDELQPPRDLSHNPFFQTMLAFRTMTLAEASLPGVEIEPLLLTSNSTIFDLQLIVTPTDDTLRIDAAFDTDLFDAATIERFLRHYQQLLHAVTTDPAARIDALPLLDAAERHALVHSFETPLPADAEATLPSLFEASVARTPQAIAVVSGDTRWSYHTLNQQANAIAHRLLAFGITPDTRVGVLLPRRAELLAALLGVIKAGGAYVPLDPTYPPERLALLIRDAAAPVVITTSALADRLDPSAAAAPAGPAAVIFRLDRDLDPLNPDLPIANPGPDRAPHPRQLAYVIYTSGSTGVPKGVGIEHRNLSAMLACCRDVFTPEQLAVTLCSTSITFDLSTYELFAPLTTGGQVVMVDDLLHLDDVSGDCALTSAMSVPSVMTEWLRTRTLPPTLRTLNLGGEPLPRTLVQELVTKTQITALRNWFGPSEDTTCSSWSDVPLHSTAPPDLGRPQGGKRGYVLDANLAPVPLGCAGELYLSGIGVSRGYLARPGLTGDRFLPDPFASTPGTRMYRSGDIVRLLPTGMLQYVGRGDTQVKIRGHRIELSEIETTMIAHPEVHEAVALAIDTEGGDRALVAYVVPKRPGADIVRSVRELLSSRLPRYLVPDTFVLLSELPKTSNGKLNRRELAARELPRRTTATVETPAATALAAFVAGAWAQVLERTDLQPTDNFFEVGGHSLRAARLSALLGRELDTSTTLRLLFEHPVLADFTTAIERAMAEHQGLTLDAPSSTPRTGPAPASLAQEALVFLDRQHEGDTAYHVPSGVRILGSLDAPALLAAIGDLTQRHEALRTVFRDAPPPDLDQAPNHAAFAHAPFADAAFEQITIDRDADITVVDLSSLALPRRDAWLRRAMDAALARPFDLAEGPLVRWVLIRCSAAEHILLASFHHAIFDGWSGRVLRRDLAQRYAARHAAQSHAGETASLPPLALQQADYAVWERARLADRTFDRSIAFWVDHIAAAPIPPLDLPADASPASTRTAAGASLTATIPPVLRRRLTTLAARCGGTLFTVCLATLNALLHRYTASERIALGTNLANRRPPLDDTIGFFVNTAIICTDLLPAMPFSTLVRQVSRTMVDAQLHQHVPLPIVLRRLREHGIVLPNPPFRVLLLFDPAATRDAWSLDGAHVEPLTLDSRQAKFDLMLQLAPRGDGLDVAWEYASDLFSRDTMIMLQANFVRLLRQVATDADVSIGSVALIDSVPAC